MMQVGLDSINVSCAQTLMTFTTYFHSETLPQEKEKRIKRVLRPGPHRQDNGSLRMAPGV